MATSLVSPTVIKLVLPLLSLSMNLEVAVSSRTLKACRTCITRGQVHGSTISLSQYSRKNYSDWHQCSPLGTKRTPAIMSRSGVIANFQSFNTNATRLPLIDVLGVSAERKPPTDSNIYSSMEGAKCEENRLYSDDDLVVSLSTGWYSGGGQCLKNIKIEGNGKSVIAKMVGEYDSVNGCDSDREFRQPCGNNVVVASLAVWKAVGILDSGVVNYSVTWSDM